MREKGMLSSGFKCSSCRQEMALVEVTPDKSSNEQELRCYKRKCMTTRSIRFKSFFSDSRLELSRILLFIPLWCKMYPIKIIEDDFPFAHQTKNQTGNQEYK
ncbi:hypothetical protein HZS_5015 [Henneguya salminicola]|nr:hypothetical protein HZS_5015 [Henneguya salminicola]